MVPPYHNPWCSSWAACSLVRVINESVWLLPVVVSRLPFAPLSREMVWIYNAWRLAHGLLSSLFGFLALASLLSV